MRITNMVLLWLSHCHNGCIKKKKKLPTLEELKVLLENVKLEDELGHLFVVDIVFDNVNEKTLLFNELYPPIFEKHKK